MMKQECGWIWFVRPLICAAKGREVHIKNYAQSYFFMRKIVCSFTNPLIFSKFFVVLGGIEPPTQGFSVLCSTI